MKSYRICCRARFDDVEGDGVIPSRERLLACEGPHGEGRAAVHAIRPFNSLLERCSRALDAIATAMSTNPSIHVIRNQWKSD